MTIQETTTCLRRWTRTSRAGDPAPWRRRVDLAEHGLGERGAPWWDQTEDQRRERWTQALSELDQLSPGA